MTFLCIHGYMRSECTMCTSISDAMEEFDMLPELDSSEYLYDYYLDLDEKALRDEEDN